MIDKKRRLHAGQRGLARMLTDGSYSLYIMGFVCFAFVLVFSYLPLAGWILSFFDYMPGYSWENMGFVGLKWFRLAVSQPALPRVLRNTLMMSGMGLLVTPVPVAFAILLSEMRNEGFKRIVQTVTTFPNFIGWIMVYVIFFTLFSPTSGAINQILRSLCLSTVDPIGNERIVWSFQTLLGLWKGMGYSAVVYLATLSGIDPELYDAADVDGAGRFAKMIHIKIPGLYPTFFVLFILNIGNLLNNGFEQYLFFYNGIVAQKIEVLDYYVYQLGIVTANYSLSTAVGMLKSVIGILLLSAANLLSKKARGESVL